MKKLVIAFAAVALAVSAHAAKAQWAFNTYTEGANAMVLDGYTAYLISSSVWTGDKSADMLASAWASVAIADASYAYTELSDDPPYTMYGNDPAYATGISDTLIGNGVDAYVVFSNGSDYYATAVTGDIVADDSFATFTVFNAADIDYTLSAKQSFSASSVPEPTSGLLMLIGVAGLALRRRRA